MPLFTVTFVHNESALEKVRTVGGASDCTGNHAPLWMPELHSLNTHACTRWDMVCLVCAVISVIEVDLRVMALFRLHGLGGMMFMLVFLIFNS